ncbi:LysR family transcriptional regulator [Paraglaciecola arctica]|uniref:LysR family transcriptional regulator n=1 Tax=Paraglaciecola arctica TaxID=1128911 RepID=UPI001C07457E|nr:LysR family transcriptional regulator [Paraglaciecola arctica]MBU3002957.1 LysR family transcriptional regulator [Paraglaciecola arctica]
MISIDPNGIPEISLRQLRALVFVGKLKNVTRAAEELNRSQTAVTKAITDLELTVGRKLFDRTSTGMIPTTYGIALAMRVQKAMDELKRAGELFFEYSRSKKSFENIPIFSMDISYKRLSAFIALYQLRNIPRAAEQLNITKAAIYSSVRQMEEWLDMELFDNGPNGVSPVSFCHVLAQHVKLAFAEIRHGIEDMANIDGITCGSVKIGTLPYTRTYLTPNAINLLLKDFPQLDVSTYESTYSAMESSLRSGDIDFIIGATRATKTNMDIRTEILFDDKLAIIARKQHPLINKAKVTLSELSQYGWVLPELNTPSGQLFIETMKSHNCEMPKHAIHTSSLSMVRGLLISSNRVALLSEHQIYYDKNSDLLDVLPVEMEDTSRSIGITMRRHTKPSPAAQLFLDKLHQVADNLINLE